MGERIRPTPAQDRLADAIRKEGALCVEYTDTGQSFFLPCGRRIAAGLVHRMLAKGKLSPNTDGLDPNSPQTFRLTYP